MLQYQYFPPLYVVKVHLIINCILVFLTIVVVALRIYLRLVSTTNHFGWDDGLILMALPFGIGMLVIQGIWAPMGIGYPLTETIANIGLILQLLVSYELIFALSIYFIKMSVLFFYLRIFVNRELRLATKGTMIFVTLWTLGNILQVFLICTPLAATYDPTVEGTCGNQVGSFIAIGAFNVITDVLILTLPLPTVWGLKTSTGTKIALTVVFLIGLLDSIVAIIRIWSLTTLDLKTNLTGTMIYADFLSAVEPNLGILCVSLPMLAPIVARLRGRGLFSSKNTAPSGGPSGNIGSNNVYTIGRGSKPRFNRMKDTENASFALDTIYAPGTTVGHHASVAVRGGSADGDNKDEVVGGRRAMIGRSSTTVSSDDKSLEHEDRDKDRDSTGSEVALASSSNNNNNNSRGQESFLGSASSAPRGHESVIRVEKVWKVQTSPSS